MSVRSCEHLNHGCFFVGIPMDISQGAGPEIGLRRHSNGYGPSLEFEPLLPNFYPLTQVSFRTALDTCIRRKFRRRTN